MTANLLPNHVRATINDVLEDSGIKIQTKVDEIKSSMDEVYHVMVKMGVIPEEKIFEEGCCFFHMANTNHTIRECENFKNLLQ